MAFGSSPSEFGYEPPPKREVQERKFVQRIYKLVPLTELEQDAYSPGGPKSGQKMPEFKEELVSERFFTGIG